MTHDKKLLNMQYSFSPVSLNDAERIARLDKNLELVSMQKDEAALPEAFVDKLDWYQRDQTVSAAIRNTTPDHGIDGKQPEHRMWILGLKLSTPCV